MPIKRYFLTNSQYWFYHGYFLRHMMITQEYRQYCCGVRNAYRVCSESGTRAVLVYLKGGCSSSHIDIQAIVARFFMHPFSSIICFSERNFILTVFVHDTKNSVLHKRTLL